MPDHCEDGGFTTLKDSLTTHDMRVIEEIASTVGGDVSVAERASAVRCVLGHYSQSELVFIIENIQALTSGRQAVRSCAPSSFREGCSVAEV